MLTRTPRDIGSRELKEPTGSSGHVLILKVTESAGTVRSEKHGRIFSGVDKSRPLELGLKNRQEVMTGSKLLNRQWEAIKNNLLAITDLVVPSKN